MPKKLLLSTTLILFLALSGCIATPKPAELGKCGDGICSDLESQRKVCPEDCFDQKNSDFEKRLMVGMMIHVEGWDNEMNDYDMFSRHVDAVMTLADKLEKYGAIGTFEARPEFVKATETWDRNVLKELSERGHGIGVHADVGGMAEKNNEDLGIITKQLIDMKTEAEKITGLTMRHVSGICSTLDWVTAASIAGFDFTTGEVAYCVMSMPEEDRPEEFRFCKSPGACHDTFPTEMIDRIHPWRMQDGTNWLTHSSTGDLVMMPSDGVLYSLDEEDNYELPDGAKGTFSAEDIDQYFVRLDQGVTLIDPLRVNTMYVAWSIGDADRVKSDLIDDWLMRTQSYVDGGQVVWSSIPHMYDEYMQWENR